MTPSNLVALLSGPTLTVRTALWLAPAHFQEQAADTAARLDIDAFDLRLPIRTHLPAGTRFLALTTNMVLEALDVACVEPTISPCLLIYNLDLLLSRLSRQERIDYWQFVFGAFPHRRCGLLFLMPQSANYLLPSESAQEAWRHDGRLVVGPAA